MQSTDDMLWFCFGHRSRKAARAVTRAFNQRLKPFGLNISQYVLLGVIARGEHGSVAAMAEEVGVEPSALLRNLKLLESRGLVAGDRGQLGGGERRGHRIGHRRVTVHAAIDDRHRRCGRSRSDPRERGGGYSDSQYLLSAHTSLGRSPSNWSPIS